MYLMVCSVWLILGAVVSPDVFLPYGAAAVTFVTVILAHYRRVRTIMTDGYKAIRDVVFQMASEQVNEMLQKMNLTGKMEELLKSDSNFELADRAANLGLIGASAARDMQERALQLAKEPQRLMLDAHKGLSDLASDPKGVSGNMVDEIKKRVIETIAENIKKLFDEDIAQLVSPMLIDFFLKDQQSLKADLRRLLKRLIKRDEGEKKRALRDLEGIFDVVIEFAFPISNSRKQDDFFRVMLEPVSKLLGFVCETTLR